MRLNVFGAGADQRSYPINGKGREFTETKKTEICSPPGVKEMKKLLKDFIGKTLKIYTISGVESYLGALEDVKNDHVVLKSYFKEDRIYLAVYHIESFKVEKE